MLALFPLDPVDTAPGAADRGSFIHDAIGDFTKLHGKALPGDPDAELTAIGRKRFAPLEDFEEAKAFWWPRFLRIAKWFVEWERARRPNIPMVYGEIRGEIEIPLGQRTFTLSARADRIERRKDGTYAVLDYKTGSPRTEPQVRTGLAPQLTLEGAILRNGGFEAHGVTRGRIAEIVYVTLKGGDPAGEEKLINFKEGDADSQSERALARFTDVAKRFESIDEPYRSLVHPMWTTYYGAYDHLARVQEWSAAGGRESDE